MKVNRNQWLTGGKKKHTKNDGMHWKIVESNVKSVGFVFKRMQKKLAALECDLK